MAPRRMSPPSPAPGYAQDSLAGTQGNCLTLARQATPALGSSARPVSAIDAELRDVVRRAAQPCVIVLRIAVTTLSHKWCRSSSGIRS
jgi:hypothetical protein